MGILSKLQRFARSPQGKKLARQAQDYAKSPQGKQKIERARKFAESRGKSGGAGRKRLG